MVSLRFHILDFLQHVLNHRRVFVGRDAQFPGFFQDVAFPGQFRYGNDPKVSHPFGGDVFVGAGILADGGYVDASFMGKGVISRIGEIGRVGAIAEFGDQPGNGGEFFHIPRGQGGEVHLQGEVRDQAAEVGVSAPFSQAVDCTLYLSRSCADGG